MPYPFEEIDLNLSSAKGPPLYWLNIALHDQSRAPLAPVFEHKPLVLMPHRIEKQASRFLKMLNLTDVVVFDDLLDSRMVSFARSPSDAAYSVADARAEGRAAVLLEYGPRVSGLLPTMLTVLAEPRLHPVKAMYSYVAGGYEIFPDQVGYICGWLDGAQRPTGYEKSWD